MNQFNVTKVVAPRDILPPHVKFHSAVRSVSWPNKPEDKTSIPSARISDGYRAKIYWMRKQVLRLEQFKCNFSPYFRECWQTDRRRPTERPADGPSNQQTDVRVHREVAILIINHPPWVFAPWLCLTKSLQAFMSISIHLFASPRLVIKRYM